MDSNDSSGYPVNLSEECIWLFSTLNKTLSIANHALGNLLMEEECRKETCVEQAYSDKFQE